MLKRLLASSAAIVPCFALALSPAAALTSQQLTPQNQAPVPNPDGYGQNQLDRMPPIGLGLGATVDGALIMPRVLNNAQVARLLPGLGHFRREGYAAPGDGGMADYVTLATPCPLNNGAGDGGSQIGLTGPMGSIYIGCAVIDWASVGGVATTALFGAQYKSDGSTQVADTAATQAALDTGRARVVLSTQGGYFYPNACLHLKTPAQHVVTDTGFGGGLIIIVPSVLATVNNGANCKGIFYADANTGPWLDGLYLSFAQPDTATLSQIIQYPPAFYLETGGRFRLDHITCAQAWVCVDMKGNSGGAYIVDLKFCAYLYGIDIDGSLDTVRLEDPHWFPFNMTGNNQQLFFSQASTRPIGINSGRMDDLVITNGLFIGGLGLNMYYDATGFEGAVSIGGTFAQITGTDFDSYSGIVNQSGSANISGSTFSIAIQGAQAIDNRGSSSNLFPSMLNISGSSMYNEASTLPFISQEAGSGSEGGAYASTSIAAVNFNNYQVDGSHLTVSAGSMVVNGTTFTRQPNVAYTMPTIAQSGTGRIIAEGNYANDKGTGSGNFASIAVDGFNAVVNNSIPGWMIVKPGTGTGASGGYTGLYSPNLIGPIGPT